MMWIRIQSEGRVTAPASPTPRAHIRRGKWRARMAAALISLVGIATLPALVEAAGEPPQHRQRQDDPRHDHRDNRQDVRRDARGYVLDGRYNHNRYYPPRGYVVPTLPRGYVTVTHRRAPYYYHQGVWYRPGRGRFIIVRPAIGLFVPILPPFYTTIWVRGTPYYYADDVYYRWRPERREYVVTEPPADAASASPSVSGDLYIYPKDGQSEERQATDRYECHSWAAGQSGFDPTQPLGGVPESQAAVKRADYQRAMTACLEARGYSVK